MQTVSNDIRTLSNGDKISVAGMDPQTAQIIINTIEQKLAQGKPKSTEAPINTPEGFLKGAKSVLDESGISDIPHWIADPKNRSKVGGAAGGILGLPFGPAGSLMGASLGAGGGSLAQKHPDQSSGDVALQAGSDALFNGLIPEAGGIALNKAITPAFEWAGRRLLSHAFGDQSAVLAEMPGGGNINSIDHLIDLKMKHDPWTPFGPQSYNKIIDKLEAPIAEKEALLSGPKGQTPVDPLAGIHPVTTHEGQEINPLKEVYQDARQGTGDTQGKVKQISKVVRDMTATPTGRGQGTGFINNPNIMEYISKITSKEDPALMQFVDDPKMLEILKGSGKFPEVQSEIQIPHVKDSITAQDMNSIVQGNYKDLSDKNAFQFENRGNPSRDALKAITRGQKESYVSAVPETAAPNKAISELIPLREAMNNVTMREASKPMFRFGDRIALATGNPKFALAAMSNRPAFEGLPGEALVRLGTLPLTKPVGETITSNLTRLLRLLTHDKDPE